MEWPVLVPVLAYLVLSLVKVRVTRGGVWPALAVWTALLVAAAVVFSRLPALPFYPTNDALQRTAGETKRYLSIKHRKDEIVLVIEGSSTATCDIRAVPLESSLRKRGLPVRVVLISAGGSNHFERAAMLREWWRRLDEKQAKALRKARVFLLAEVLHTYDYEPLSGFAENAFSERSVAYATPENLGPMLRAAWEKSRANGGASLRLIPLIAQHVFFNAFRVGTFQCLRPPAEEYSNRGAGGTPAGPVAADPGGKRRAVLGGGGLPYPWWHVGDRVLHDAIDGWVDEIGYWAPPLRSDLEEVYQRNFLAAVPREVLRIQGVHALPDLQAADLWRDRAHLNGRGAAVFTEWLAGQIAAQWPRIARSAAVPPDGN